MRSVDLPSATTTWCDFIKRVNDHIASGHAVRADDEPRPFPVINRDHCSVNSDHASGVRRGDRNAGNDYKRGGAREPRPGTGAIAAGVSAITINTAGVSDVLGPHALRLSESGRSVALPAGRIAADRPLTRAGASPWFERGHGRAG